MAWVVDPAHTTVGFSARHMGLSTVRGRFTRFNGTVEGDLSDITSARARFEVEMDSIDTGQEQRDEHLRGGDFFDVQNHPKMIFVTKSIAAIGGDRYAVVGDLTIKGITREVELAYEHAGAGTDPYGNRRLGGSVTGTINRSEWGLKWNVALDTGGWLVSDKIKLEIDLQVTESTEAAEEEAQVEAALSS